MSISRVDEASAKPAGVSGPSAYWLLFACTALFLVLPVLSVRWIPMLDLPNHIARTYILYHYGEVANFQRQLQLDWSPLPNLAMDVFIVAAQRFVNVFMATRLFLVLDVFLFLLGSHLLGRELNGGNTYRALFCASFVYTATFLFGFVNFVSGMALYFVAFALFLRWRQNFTPPRIAVWVLLSLVTYFSHLAGLGFLAVSVGVVALIDVAERRSWTHFAVSIAILLPALAFAVYHQAHYRSAEARIAYAGVADKVAVAGSVIRTFSLKVDVVLVLLILAMAVLIAVTGRSLRIHWRGMALAIIFALIAIFAPFEIATSQYFDLRFVVPAWVLLMLSIKVDVRPAASRAIAVLAILFVAIRVGSIWVEWHRLSDKSERIVQALSVLPENCRVAERLYLPQDAKSRGIRMIYTHAAEYSTITRHCVVENLLAIPGQQPILWKKEFAVPPGANNRLDEAPTASDADHLVTYRPPQWLRDDLQRSARQVYNSDQFSIWALQDPRH